jgi:hypothetical protein
VSSPLDCCIYYVYHHVYTNLILEISQKFKFKGCRLGLAIYARKTLVMTVSYTYTRTHTHTRTHHTSGKCTVVRQKFQVYPLLAHIPNCKHFWSRLRISLPELISIPQLPGGVRIERPDSEGTARQLTQFYLLHMHCFILAQGP